MLHLLFCNDRRDAGTPKSQDAEAKLADRSAYQQMLARELPNLPPLAA